MFQCCVFRATREGAARRLPGCSRLTSARLQRLYGGKSAGSIRVARPRSQLCFLGMGQTQGRAQRALVEQHLSHWNVERKDVDFMLLRIVGSD